MKALGLIALLLAGCNACQPSPPPPPPPAPPVATAQTPAQIYEELVAAKCMAPTDAGPSDVAKELALPNPPQWMKCLADGGSVAVCGGCSAF